MKKRPVYDCGQEYRTNPLSTQNHENTVTVHYMAHSVSYDSVKSPKAYLKKVLDGKPRPVAYDVNGERYWTSPLVESNPELSRLMQLRNTETVKQRSTKRTAQSAQGDRSLPF